MTRTIGYIRVSTGRQADEGVSLEAQRSKIEDYAKLEDLDLVRVESDTQTAKTLERPALQRALAALKSGEADALLVTKLDRLTRSIVDLGYLLEHYFKDGKCTLMSWSEKIDTSSAAGRLVLNILIAVAQWEREAIGERTSAAMRHMASEGKYTGGAVRYGFKLSIDGVTLIEDREEQKVIELARALHGTGLSLNAVARELSSLGFRGRTGKDFQAVQVRNMLNAA